MSAIVPVNPDIPKDINLKEGLKPPANKLSGGGDKGQVFNTKADALKAANGVFGAVAIENPDKSWSIWINPKLEVYQKDKFSKSKEAEAAAKVHTLDPVVVSIDIQEESKKDFNRVAPGVKHFSDTWMQEITDPKGGWATVGKWIVKGMSLGDDQDKFIKGARAEVKGLYDAAMKEYQLAEKGEPGHSFLQAKKLMDKANARANDYLGSTTHVIDTEVGVGQKVTEEIKEKTELAIELISCLAGPGAAAKGPQAAARAIKFFGSEAAALKFLASKYGPTIATKVATVVFGAGAGAVAGGTAEGAKAVGEGKSGKDVAKATGHGLVHGAEHGAVNAAIGLGLGTLAGKFLHAASAEKAVEHLVKQGLPKDVAMQIVGEKGVHTAHHVLEWLEKKGMVEMTAILGKWATKSSEPAAAKH